MIKHKKILTIILSVLLLVYPIYALASDTADTSPNMLLLEGSNSLGVSSLGLSGTQGDLFFEKYIVNAPDRKIPLASDFDLFYGINITDKEDNPVKNTIGIVDNDGFDSTLEGNYNITYQVTVENHSATFSRVIFVTPYRVDMNDLVIVKETGEEIEEFYGEDDDKVLEFFASYEPAASTVESGMVENSDLLSVDGVYYVAPADASIFKDNSVLDNLKKAVADGTIEVTVGTYQVEPEVGLEDEDFDILSTNPDSENLKPLDLRYGIKVLNDNGEDIAENLEVVNDDGFSMNMEESKQYEVDYAIVHEGNVVVELRRNVNVLGNTRTGATTISAMSINQTVLDSSGTPTLIDATWGVDGNLLVNVDGVKQYAGPSSGTALRFLDGPLEVSEKKQNGSEVTHQVVGDNIHSFLGYYMSNVYKNRNGLAMFDFDTLSGEQVARRGFVGADDNTKRSPILTDSEAALRSVITDANLVEEFDVFNQSSDTLSMTRKYKYYPNAGLLNKSGTGQVLNDKPLFELLVTVRFAPNELRLLREITITNLAKDYYDAEGKNPVFEGHLLYLADTFFGGNDYGFGFRDEINDSVYVRGVEDGARTMLLTGQQPSEATYVGAWHLSEPDIPKFVARYQEVYGQSWFDETVRENATQTGLFTYKNTSGTTIVYPHTQSPHYSLNTRTPLEGELPKNLNSMAYPVTKTLFATDIPGGGTGTGKSFINGSIDMAYAMQWKLPPTAVGESYTFVVEENWLDAADIQIVAPGKKVVTAGQTETLRFSAENTHMFDYALPAGGQEWELEADFTLETVGIGGASSWSAVIDKIYRSENGSLVEVPFTGTTSTTLTVKPGEKYYFDVKVTVDRKALGEQENKITLNADATSAGGHNSISHDFTNVEAFSPAVITSVAAQERDINKVVAKVVFNNPALIDPEDPTVVYNTTVKLYDNNNVFISEVSEKISSKGTLTLTGFTLLEGVEYKLVATAEPEAKGTVNTTFTLSSEEAELAYAKNPDYAIITGMPSPLIQTVQYIGGKADFTLASAPTAVGLVFKGWEDTDTNQIHNAGSTFSMLLSNPRRKATLETTWNVDPNYKITVDFDTNTGEGMVASQSKFVGDTVNAPTETITKTGYKLSGWTTTKGDNSSQWDFTAKLSGVPPQITLYAYWEYDSDSWEVTIVEAPQFIFNDTQILSGNQVVSLNNAGTLKIRDTYPGTAQNWQLSVSTSQLKAAGDKLLSKNALQYFDSSGNGQSVYYNSVAGEGSPVVIWTEPSSSTQFDYQRTFGTSLNESFGVSLLSAEGVVAEYESTLTWRIVIAP